MTERQINTDAPVLVTGATGYVAGQLIKSLLELGVTVHAAVRDPNNSKKLTYLDELAETLPGQIKYFKSDLLDMGSYQAAMQDCEVVFHTASPFILSVRDPEEDLVKPAKLGTRNVLESASNTPTVKRVVLTSSVVAMYSDNADIKQTPEGKLTEDVWNTSSSLTHQPYAYSKTLAEKEAWEIANAQSQWDLVVINPSLVIGPGINPFATSESFNIVKQLGNGTMKAGLPHWEMGVVDVRDLAQAHISAAFIPSAKGRYIVSGHNTDLVTLGEVLLPKYGNDYPIPRKTLPKWLVWLLGPLTDKTMTRKLVADNVGHPFKADNSKGIKELGISYRSIEQSMNEFFQQMIDSKQIKI